MSLLNSTIFHNFVSTPFSIDMSRQLCCLFESELVLLACPLRNLSGSVLLLAVQNASFVPNLAKLLFVDTGQITPQTIFEASLWIILSVGDFARHLSFENFNF